MDAGRTVEAVAVVGATSSTPRSIIVTSTAQARATAASPSNPVAELNRLIAEFGGCDRTRVELRPVADHNCWGDPSKALFRGACDGNISLLRAALCSGMDPDTYFRGQTPLMFAAENGHTAACLLLLVNGATVNLLDRYRRSALHYAARNRHVACAAALMDAGANSDLECSLGGETPQDLARVSGDRQLVRFVNFDTQNVDEIRRVLLDSVSHLENVEWLALTTLYPRHAADEGGEKG